MNEFDNDEKTVGDKFIKEFGKHFKYRLTDKYAHTDITYTAITSNKRYNTELKQRNYHIEEISGSTILERTKLDYFKQLYKQDSNVCLTYFNFYKNNNWISFDITNRIRYNEGLNKSDSRCLPSTTSISGYDKDKDVIYLEYTKNMYVQDKMHYVCTCQDYLLNNIYN